MKKATMFLLMLGLCAAAARTEVAAGAVPPGFDPHRHMRVDEVRPGMTGYGLSVFQGTHIERFDVEVISILRNFSAKHDVILIRAGGANLEHTGSVSGMSGSPIYLRDEQGRDRMVGAFAYGWAMTKDPIAGVQPIEYMLGIPDRDEQKAVGPGGSAVTGRGVGGGFPRNPQSLAGGGGRWSLEQAFPLPGSERVPAEYPLAGWNVFRPNPQLTAGVNEAMQLRPLATPLMAGGLSPELLEQLGPVFGAYGIMPVQAGGGSGTARLPDGAAAGQKDDSPGAPLEPGSVMAVPLLTGDLEFTAVGTTTEVLGERVLGFGHPFMNEGPVALPMGSGQISAVIPSMMVSFKLGSLTQLRGTLHADHAVGVSGRLGAAPAKAPIELRVVYSDGSQDETYRFESALHPRFTPLLSAAAVANSVRGNRDLPEHHTLEYDIELHFANGRSVHLKNTIVDAMLGDIFHAVGGPMLAAADNPFERVMVSSVRGTIRVVPEARTSSILSVHLPRRKFEPGETLSAFVTHRPFRSAELVLPLTIELPADLPDGEYTLSFSDWLNYMIEERKHQPFRFTAENGDEVFAALNDLASIRRDAMYVRLLRQADGVAVGRTALPRLPASHRQMLLDSGRSTIAGFASSTVHTFPTPYVMSGSAEFTIKIENSLR